MPRWAMNGAVGKMSLIACRRRCCSSSVSSAGTVPIMPEAVRALVLEAPRRLVAGERARPAPTDDSGLLRVEACGLCGTDHEQYTGSLNPGWAFVPGHEVVGLVE